MSIFFYKNVLEFKGGYDMNKQIISSVLVGAFTLSCLNTSVYAKGEAEYQVQQKNAESMQDVFSEVYTKKVGKLTYKKTETKKNESIAHYESKEYVVDCEGLNLSKEGKQKVTLTLTQKGTGQIVEQDETTIEVEDMAEPTLELSQSSIDTIQNKSVELTDYVHASDGKGNPLEVQLDGDVDYSQVGSYTVKASATDSYGQEVSSDLVITVNEDTFYQDIANAALSQIGVNQDCTMLVTNSLKAVGIDFHGWPTDYLSLGNQTDSPVPGDICVYQGHVALYVGNGQAVHGGWLGSQTVLSSVECSNAFIAYVHVNHV